MMFGETERDLVVNMAATQPFWTIQKLKKLQIKLD